MIEREIPGAGALSEAQIHDLAMHSLRELGPQIQWLHSYVTEDKVYCVYLAPDEDSISGTRPQGWDAGRPGVGGAPSY